MTTDLQSVKICDMGISKLKDISQATATTLSPNPTETFPYMAPKMFGQGGGKQLIYNTLSVALELFGQQRVWGTSTGMEIMQNVCGSFNSLPQLPTIDCLPMHIRKACCQLNSSSHPKITEVVKMLRLGNIFYVLFFQV